MAGRGRAATLPAWMVAQQGAAATAPGAVSPAPTYSGGVGAPPPAAAGGWVQSQSVPQAAQHSPARFAAPAAAAAAPSSLQQPAARPAAAPATAAASASASGPLKPGWTEHTAPDGRKYYYHAATKTSSWARPVVEADAAGGAAGAGNPMGDWKEYTSPDGRKYYYNKLTKESKWTLPEEVKMRMGAGGGATASPAAVAPVAAPAVASAPVGALPAAVQRVRLAPAAAAQANGGPAGSSAAQPVSRPSPQPLLDGDGKFQYATKEEAKDAFKELLASVGAASDWTWDQAMRLIINDRRYNALKSLGEKKACFNEYAQQRKKTEKEEARLRARAQRDAFVEMLGEGDLLAGVTRISRAKELLDDDPRWQVIDQSEREALFAEFVKNRERREKEERRARQREAAAAFKALLEATPWVKASTPWRKAQVRLEGQTAFEDCDKLERLDVFQQHIRALEAAEKEQREREKEERRRQERRNRDAFRNLLQEHLAAEILHAKIRWKEYHEIVKKEPALRAVEGNLAGSTAKELFEDVLEAAEQAYEEHRSTLKQAVRDAGLTVTPSTAFSEFEAALAALDVPKLAEIPEMSRKLYHDELIGKALDRIAKEERRAKRAREDFAAHLKSSKALSGITDWAEAKPLLEKDAEYQALKGEEEAAALFEGYVAYHRAKKEASKSKRSHKRRHGSSESDDDEGGREREKSSKRHKKDKDKDKSRHKGHKRDSSRRRSSHQRSASEAAPADGGGTEAEGDAPPAGDAVAPSGDADAAQPMEIASGSGAQPAEVDATGMGGNGREATQVGNESAAVEEEAEEGELT